MFEAIQKRLSGALQGLRGRSHISEKDVENVLNEIRTGLLEGDVHFRVTRDFLARVKDRCMREEVLKSLAPQEQILKVLSDELTLVLGGQNRGLDFSVKPPAVLVMLGLQGSGKTTSSVKLAQHLKDLGKRVAVVSVDIYRPAAMEQLKQLSSKSEITCYPSQPDETAQAIAKRALQQAKDENAEVLIVDTAGRLQIDEALMKELQDICEFLNPVEKLLVVDSMMGQQAVEVAEGFDRVVSLTGSILTKLDSDTRGGAALSLVSVTGKPIKFIGTGERPTDFEVFHPDRMASRILDMGDVLSLIEKAEKVISEDEAREAAQKFSTDSFNFEDFQKQLKMMSRMGSMGSLLKMMPGMGAIKDQIDSVDTEKELGRVNAIINSMTLQERRQPDVLNGSRRARIARGSGRTVSDVNQLVKRFSEARKMMKQMGGLGKMFKGGGGGSGGGNPFGGGGKRGKGFGRKF